MTNRMSRLAGYTLGSLLGTLGTAAMARADENTAIASMERQIRQFQQQLSHMKQEQAAERARIRNELRAQREMLEADPYAPLRRSASLPPAPRPGASTATTLPYGDTVAEAPRSHHWMDDLFGNGEPLAPARTAPTPYGELIGAPPPLAGRFGPLRRGQLQIGGIRVTLGGYLEAATFWRSRNTGTDISSSYPSIPWGNEALHHLDAFHQSERQSRLSVLIQGKLSRTLEADAYLETDFQGAGSASNSRQSNSYVLRTRSVYGEVRDRARGWYLLAGQNWSLLSLSNKGMYGRNEQVPLTIDSQYAIGYSWTRSAQLRLVKSLDRQDHYALGLSIEAPSAVPDAHKPPAAAGTITDRVVHGANVNNPDTYYTTDPAPDTVLKATADPGWGHYELTGIMRFFRDRTSGLPGRAGRNRTAIAGAGGGGMILPLIKNKLHFQASGLIGTGLGRYSVSNLPDYGYRPNGSPHPLPEANLLLGLYGNPAPALRLYAYGGLETVLHRQAYDDRGTAYGYGNRAYDMRGCSVELARNCAASSNIHTVAQGIAGFWYTAAKGDYGTLLVGGQYSHTELSAFSGVGGTPHNSLDMVFMSLRYQPFN